MISKRGGKKKKTDEKESKSKAVRAVPPLSDWSAGITQGVGVTP